MLAWLFASLCAVRFCAALAVRGRGGDALEAGAGGAGGGGACPALGYEMQDTNVTAVQAALVALYGQRISRNQTVVE